MTLERLSGRLADLKVEWSGTKPFRYLVMDDFLPLEFAEEIFNAYPQPDPRTWDATTYIHQRKKFTQTKDFPGPIAAFFELTACEGFRNLISTITGVEKLIDDPDLVGGGLHQITHGGFLDVHVDYNLHPYTKLYRRLNLLLYMNKNWKPEYKGYFELWDLEADRQLEHVAPIFNRAVLFETNEISYHGHPRPLEAPENLTRKSLAIYYYTKDHDQSVVAPEHNTLYRQTTGISGYLKTTASAARAVEERIAGQGPIKLSKDLARRTYRYLQRLPPENK